MKLKKNNFFYSDSQLFNEIKKCEYCENKPCTSKCPADCSPTDFIRAAAIGDPSDFKRASALIIINNK
jgi:CO dehydrogenase/acetyl-CoA synthase alpha subunit